MDQPVPEQQGAPAPEQEMGPLTKLVGQVHEGLMGLAEAADQFPPEVQKGFVELVQKFEALVQAAVGGQSSEEEQVPGPTSMEAGVSGAKPAL